MSARSVNVILPSQLVKPVDLKPSQVVLLITNHEDVGLHLPGLLPDVFLIQAIALRVGVTANISLEVVLKQKRATETSPSGVSQ